GSTKISPYLNRYVLLSNHIDVITFDDAMYVYTKMCRLLLFGRIYERHPRTWDGMQVRSRKGDIRPRAYKAPGALIAYLNEKADEVMDSLDSLSPRQQAIVSNAIRENADAIANSDVFTAMQADVKFSGRAAFGRRSGSSVRAVADPHSP